MPATKEVPGVEDAGSPQPLFFLRLRTTALGCITFLSFLWIVLFCIIIFLQWDLVDRVERSIILIMLFLDTFTLIMLPLLLTRPFRPWLDAARVVFIILTHGGIAILFAVKSPSFQCIHSGETSSNQDTVCTSLIIYLNVFSWLIPALAIIYGIGLVILVRKLSGQGLESDAPGDVEKHISSSPSMEEDASTQNHEATLKKHLTLDSMAEIPQTSRVRASVSTVNKEKLKRHLTCDSIYEVPQPPSPAQMQPSSRPEPHYLQPVAPTYAPPPVRRNTRVHDSYQSQYTVSSYYGPSSSSRSSKTAARDSYRAAYRVPAPGPRDGVPNPTPIYDKNMKNARQSFQSHYTLNSAHETRQYAYAV